MADIKRDVKMTIRLSDDEEAIRNLLELHLGTDGNSVMRMGMLDLARSRGVKLPDKTSKVDRPVRRK